MTENQILEAARKSLGIESLNPLQLAVSASTASRLIILAPTGSGKTLAFTLAMLRDINASRQDIKAVVIAPSRELVIRIAGVVRPLALPGSKPVALYGGHSFADERSSLSVTPDIIIATPGRLLDHLNRDTIGFIEPCVVVLDEYDKALELGFHDEMRRVVRRLGRPRHIILTSATPLAEAPDFINLANAETIDFSDTSQPDIAVARVASPERDKLDTLMKLLAALPDGKTIVFVNHRESAERVYDALRRKGFPAALYHGGLERASPANRPSSWPTTAALPSSSPPTSRRAVSTSTASAPSSTTTCPSLPKPGHTATAAQPAPAPRATSMSSPAQVEDADYVVFDRDADISTPAAAPIRASKTTLYIDAGKKEKISRGDVAGYLIAAGNLPPEAIGRIIVKDHASYAAVDRNVAGALLEAVKGRKLKNRRVRVTVAKP